MKLRTVFLVLMISLGSTLVSCEEVEGPDPIPTPIAEPVDTPDDEEDDSDEDDTPDESENPDVEKKLPAVVIQIAKTANPTARYLKLTEYNEAIITIQTMNGESTSYNMKKIQIQDMGSYYLTEKIILPEGSYQVVAFYVVDESNAIVEATPKKKSTLSDDETLSLPLAFEVQLLETEVGEEAEMQLSMKVVSAEGKSPADFGFQSFGLNIVKPVSFQFYIAMVSDSRLMDFLPGSLEITVNDEVITQELIAGINKAVDLPNAASYSIIVKSFNWKDYSLTLTQDQLEAYSTQPLILEMEEVEIKCVGGEYPQSLVLTTQTELNNWAKRCHTDIQGNLTILGSTGNDPIVDLSPLELVTHIFGDLTINNTTKLNSLHGLHNLTTVEGWAKISDNSSLESLDGLSLPQDSHIHLTIEDNPSLLNLRGLENVYSLGYVDISSNASLVNFEGLNQLTTLYDLRVALNGAQTSFEGLGNLRNVGTFEIVGLNISNFDGLNRLESISSLLLYSSNKVSDFKSLPATVTSTLDIMGSSIRSLEGLKLTDQLINLFLRDNYELSNIRALSSLKKITRRFSIEGNSYLPSLAGLENLSLVGIEGNFGYKMEIRNNDYLADFCALTKLFTEGSYHEADIRWNGYNPTVDQIKEGECVSDLY